MGSKLDNRNKNNSSSKTTKLIYKKDVLPVLIIGPKINSNSDRDLICDILEKTNLLGIPDKINELNLEDINNEIYKEIAKESLQEMKKWGNKIYEKLLNYLSFKLIENTTTNSSIFESSDFYHNRQFYKGKTLTYTPDGIKNGSYHKNMLKNRKHYYRYPSKKNEDGYFISKEYIENNKRLNFLNEKILYEKNIFNKMKINFNLRKNKNINNVWCSEKRKKINLSFQHFFIYFSYFFTKMISENTLEKDIKKNFKIIKNKIIKFIINKNHLIFQNVHNKKEIKLEISRVETDDDHPTKKEICSFLIIAYYKFDMKKRFEYIDKTLSKKNSNNCYSTIKFFFLNKNKIRILTIYRQNWFGDERKKLDSKILIELQNNFGDKISSSSFAYRKNGNNYMNSFEKHIPNIRNKDFFGFKTDLKDFFNSINMNDEKNKEIKNELLSNYFLNNELHLKKSLQQGTRLAPILSNIFFKKIDNEIEKYCNKKEYAYSRYSDDIFISGLKNNEKIHNIKDKIIKKIKFILMEYNDLKLNIKKTKIWNYNNVDKILGLNVGGGRLFLPHRKREKIVYQIKNMNRNSLTKKYFIKLLKMFEDNSIEIKNIDLIKKLIYN